MEKQFNKQFSLYDYEYSDIIASLAKKYNLSIREIKQIVSCQFRMIAKSIREGKDIKIKYLGVFRKKYKFKDYTPEEFSHLVLENKKQICYKKVEYAKKLESHSSGISESDI
jgi:nucleoid DNA-binding protein